MTDTQNDADHTVTATRCAQALQALREGRPLVQCLTNIVVANFTANALLAVGAAPAMVDNPHEAGSFSRITSAVLVNLGTLYDDTAAGMRAAVAGASEAGTPWVLDPVAAGGLAWRTELARELVVAGPAVIRGNASEILGLVGGGGGRGVDSADDPGAALSAAQRLAERHRCVVAVSGARDLITDGRKVVRMGNGVETLTRVTGAGCALGALIAAFCAVSDDRLIAASAATASLCVAAEEAAASSSGPGSFAVALLDELARITPERVAERIVIG